jgi:hypothetical protein
VACIQTPTNPPCFFIQAQNKDEIKEYLDSLMAQEGAIGYVLINYDGK